MARRLERGHYPGQDGGAMAPQRGIILLFQVLYVPETCDTPSPAQSPEEYKFLSPIRSTSFLSAPWAPIKVAMQKLHIKGTLRDI